METTLYNMEPVAELIETVFMTAFLPETNPTSILLVGPSGVAKSMLISRYASDIFKRTDSISSQGLFDIADEDRNQTVKFLIIPDFNPTMSRKASTVEATIANLLSFTADGMVRIDDGRKHKDCQHNPVGVITASTPEIYNKYAKKWYSLGITRRILAVFYDYTPATIQLLHEKVSDGNITNVFPEKIIMRPEAAKIMPVIPEQFNYKLQSCSDTLAHFMGKIAYWKDGKKQWSSNKIIPIAPHVTLKNIIRAHAALNGREICSHDDMDFVFRFLEFSDPQSPKMI